MIAHRQSDRSPADDVFGAPFAVPDGATLFRKGDRMRSVFSVVSGAILLVASGQGDDGLVAVRAAGRLVGAAPAIDGRRTHLATAVTLGPSELRQVSVEEFLASRARHPAVGLWTGDLLAAEAMDQFHWLAAVGTADLRTRLLHVLAALFQAGSTERRDGSLRLSLGMTRTRLARLVSAERESVVRLFAKFESEHVIVRKDGWLIVPTDSPLRAIISTEQGHQ